MPYLRQFGVQYPQMVRGTEGNAAKGARDIFDYQDEGNY